jgi:hypothetical protein
LEAGHGVEDERLQVLVAGDVAVRHDGATACLLAFGDGRLERIHTAASENKRCALGGEFDGRGTTDAAAAPRHDDYLTLKRISHAAPPAIGAWGPIRLTAIVPHSWQVVVEAPLMDAPNEHVSLSFAHPRMVWRRRMQSSRMRPILLVMNDFRHELASVVDQIIADGGEPIFLMIDLVGAEVLRQSHDLESLDRLRETCMASLSSAASGAPTFTYGDIRVIGILQGFDRLKTFALVEKLRRMFPLLAQSFDCNLAPEFDTIEYDERTGVSGVINQLIAPRREIEAA